jgi:glycerophosphoryl diester phosphodiesterase
MKYFLFFFLLIPSIQAMCQGDSVSIFGHRGCRGLLAENSIEGFSKAIELGVDGIELDVVVNKNGQLVISHEPYFQSEFCLGPNNEEISTEKAHNIYEMSQEEIEKFDCGSKGNKNYPEQILFKMHKPLLKDLFSAVDLSSTQILFEIKSSPKEYGLSQPQPKEYVRIIMEELDSFPHFGNITFMSFDKNILEELHNLTNEKHQLDNGFELKTVYLTYLPFKSAKTFLNDLTFKPSALGMFYPTASRRKANYLRKEGLKLFVWTVNDPKKAKKLKRIGVNGIITDFPDKVQ